MVEQLSFNRSNTAVLIMDYQNRQMSSFSEDFQNELITRVNKVLAKARQDSIPVIYVEVLRGERTPQIEPSGSDLNG